MDGSKPHDEVPEQGDPKLQNQDGAGMPFVFRDAPAAVGGSEGRSESVDSGGQRDTSAISPERMADAWGKSWPGGGEIPTISAYMFTGPPVDPGDPRLARAQEGGDGPGSPPPEASGGDSSLFRLPRREDSPYLSFQESGPDGRTFHIHEKDGMGVVETPDREFHLLTSVRPTEEGYRVSVEGENGEIDLK